VLLSVPSLSLSLGLEHGRDGAHRSNAFPVAPMGGLTILVAPGLSRHTASALLDAAAPAVFDVPPLALLDASLAAVLEVPPPSVVDVPPPPVDLAGAQRMCAGNLVEVSSTYSSSVCGRCILLVVRAKNS
jgi:hypothetical protein